MALRSVYRMYSVTSLRRVRLQKLSRRWRKPCKSLPAPVNWLLKALMSPKMLSSIRVDRPYSSRMEFCSGVAVSSSLRLSPVAQRMAWPVLLLSR